MKYVLLLALLAFVFYMLGRKRQGPPPAAPRPPPAAPQGQAMVACAQCGLHLPQGEALPGRGGVFCSAEHRTAYEAAHFRT